MNSRLGRPADYVADTEMCERFLRTFEKLDPMTEETRPAYMDLLVDVAARRKNVIDIQLADMQAFPGGGADLCDRICANVLRYVDVFSDAVDAVLRDLPVQFDRNDPLDVLFEQRLRAQTRAMQERAVFGPGAGADAAAPGGGAGQQQAVNPEAQSKMPPALTRRYEIRFTRPPKVGIKTVREIRARDIGKLTCLRGVVTRVSDVRPRVVVATYTCDQCGCEIYQEVFSRTYTPLSECPSERCQINQLKGRLYPQTRGSRFVKFQELKLQELSDDVPMGHIPRTITVHIAGELTRQCGPGDVVMLTGVYLPVPVHGYRAMKQGLVADTYFECMQIEKNKRGYRETVVDEEVATQIDLMHAEGTAYERLSYSIAPEIFGHDDVKKAVLLLLLGGVTRTQSDGMRIRGDINVCLMGDPGVAKSQLLKACSRISPRGVYTTGKGSTGVGLTAAVMRDPTTNELVLEGGALVLADMGVCCIDEFDKMEEGDRTSIHEVMEQQTVSIAKAGITTTLNARTSILAAANPVWGRYNPKRSPTENINLPAALLSRFDILFLLLDRPDSDKDLMLAKHVTFVHQNMKAPPTALESVSASFIRAYIGRARRFEPLVSPDAENHLVETYLHMRQDERNAEHTYVTARSLLSVLRMAQAHARLSFRDVVLVEDIDEALRLLQVSKQSLYSSQGGGMDDDHRDKRAKAFQMINEYARQRQTKTVRLDDLSQRFSKESIRQADIDFILTEYEEGNIWMVSEDRKSITFV